jgi:hypothetical protein
MNKVNRYLIAALLLGVGYPLLAQDVFIYPAQDQSAEQQDKDKYECYNWAKSNTGYDPVNPPAASSASAPPPQKTGGVARGAVVGATIGVIAGDSSKAAGRGAATGALFGGVRQHRENEQAAQQQQQRQQQQASQSSAKKGDYNRAYGACLEGRGYTVK